VREVPRARILNRHALEPELGVGWTFLSKVENGKLDFGACPSVVLIREVAKVQDADLDWPLPPC
jgi:HTH-type transcriptional regulator, competence development regulator